MGLFDKKFCDVCGERIKFLGNRKLEDGNLCKECASKLSPWFSERRSSTVEEIKAQLAYREQNQIAINDFEETRSIGRGTRVLIDEPNNRLVVAKTNNIREENPDIIEISNITDCKIDIREERKEEKKELEDGREISYNPPRYTWEYNFRVIMRVKHPFFDDIEFNMNRSTVYINSEDSAYRSGGRFNPRQHPDYLEYAEMCEELKEAIAGKKEAPVEAAPKQAVVCPYCGATTVPDARGCCEYCDAPVGN